jgi:hypothetical protein
MAARERPATRKSVRAVDFSKRACLVMRVPPGYEGRIRARGGKRRAMDSM